MSKGTNLNLKADEIFVCAVEPKLLDKVWWQVVPLLERVISRGNVDYTVESTKDKIISGDTVLMLVVDGQEVIGMFTMEPIDYESGLRALAVPIIAGVRHDEWMDLWVETLKTVAREQGRTKIRGMSVRKGWLRKLKKHNWTEVHTIIECEV